MKCKIGDYMNTEEILADPSIHYWVKDQFKKSFDRDLLDSLRDAELLLKMLEARWNSEVK